MVKVGRESELQCPRCRVVVPPFLDRRQAGQLPTDSDEEVPDALAGPARAAA